MTIQSRGLTESRDKLKPVHLHCHNLYDDQTGDADFLWGVPFIKVHGPLVTWSCAITWQTKTVILPLPQSLWQQKLREWCLMRVPTHKITRSLVTQSCEITRQTKTIISLLTQCLWTPNLVGWWLTFTSSHSSSHIILQWHDLVRSRDKLKPWYLIYNKAFGHQTCEGSDLPWEDLSWKVT